MAEELRKAMKGWGTDNKALVKIIGPKTNAELQTTRTEYAEKFSRDLIKDLKSECSGSFEDVLVGLVEETAAYDAQLCKRAMKGLGTNEDLLSEVLCTRTGEELVAARAAYKTLYGNDMLSDLEDETSGDLEKIYNLLLTGTRQNPGDEHVAEDVLELYKAGAGKWGTNEGVFIRKLAGYDREYNEKLYWAYAKKYGIALDAVIQDEMGGNVAKALVALVTPLHIYFSRRLFKSMDGVGTNDEMLIRLVCSQKERHLHAAAFRFLQDYKRTLKVFVQSECGGNYKSLLVSTIEAFCETEQAPDGFGIVVADPVIEPVETPLEEKQEEAPEEKQEEAAVEEPEPAPAPEPEPEPEAAPAAGGSNECATEGCSLTANDNQGHGHCCRKCKNGKGHGGACTQTPASGQAPPTAVAATPVSVTFALAVSRKSDNVSVNNLIIVDGGEGFYELDFTVPDGAPGSPVSFSLQFAYASGDPRPVAVSVNGSQCGSACTSASGGWDESALVTEALGPLTGVGGGEPNTVRIEAHSFFPHVQSVSIVPPP